MDRRERYFTLTELKQRGWNDKLLAQLLGEPDVVRENPYYRSGPPMRLYRDERVLAAEETPTFRKRKEEFERRSDAAGLGAETRREKTLQRAENLATHIHIPELSLEELAKRAAEHKYYLDLERNPHGDCGKPAFHPWDDEDTFRDRICVNYLRHVTTGYDAALGDLYAQTGKAQARLVLFEAVTRTIAATYPQLAPEAYRQMETRRANEQLSRVMK